MPYEVNSNYLPFKNSSISFDFYNVRIKDSKNTHFSEELGSDVDYKNHLVSGHVDGVLKCVADIDIYTPQLKKLTFKSTEIDLGYINLCGLYIPTLTKNTDLDESIQNTLYYGSYTFSTCTELYKFAEGDFNNGTIMRSKDTPFLSAFVTTSDSLFIQTIIDLFAEYESPVARLVQLSKRNLLIYGDIISECESGYELTKDRDFVIITNEDNSCYATVTLSDIQKISVQELTNNINYQLFCVETS